MNEIITLVNEMSPYLLLGFLIAGLMHAFIPATVYHKYLSADSFRSVITAALFGIPLPLCSCGVIPTAMSLRREGASHGATVSFLIATPQTGIDSIFATYSLLGLPFAVVRPIAALVTAILGGVMVNTLGGSGEKAGAAIQPVSDTRSSGSDSHTSFLARLREALHFGFVEMMEDIGKWLVIGLVIAGIITVCVPDSAFAAFRGNTALSMLLVLCISIPMYLCATGSIPIAVALMMKGLTPGAALVLLMAGPASNAASILVIRKVLGWRTLVLYLASIVLGAVAFGCIIDLVLPSEWFTSSLISRHACCHHESGILEWGSTALLALLLLNVLCLHLRHGHSHCHCDGHCHDHAGHQEHCSCGCEPQQAETASPVRLRVLGMNCNHCRANVERAIQSVSGVEAVTVDLASGVAEITGTAIDIPAIRSAVESIGFEVE